MRQRFLPGFPEGAQRIGEMVSILEKDGQVTYFFGSDNYYAHPVGDQQGRRFALTSLMANRHLRAVDLQKEPLCIPHRTLMHWKKQYAKEGPTSFFRVTSAHKPRIMTPEIIAECSQLLGEGHCIAEVARRAGIDESTTMRGGTQCGNSKGACCGASHVGADQTRTGQHQVRAQPCRRRGCHRAGHGMHTRR